jgi:hypothetical protein
MQRIHTNLKIFQQQQLIKVKTDFIMNFGTLLISLYNSSKKTDMRTLLQHVI